jgi:hypothetical protein
VLLIRRNPLCKEIASQSRFQGEMCMSYKGSTLNGLVLGLLMGLLWLALRGRTQSRPRRRKVSVRTDF